MGFIIEEKKTQRLMDLERKEGQFKEPSDEPISILLATNHLFGFTGSEITILTIAKCLKEQNHNVSIYAKYVDKNFAMAVNDISKLYTNIKALSHHRFDVAYVQHHTTALEVRCQFPDLPMVFASLGVVPFLEQPPIVDLDIYTYLAISEEVKANLLRKGIDESKITIFRNVVDSRNFKPTRHLNPIPKTAFIYSYKMDEKNAAMVIKACASLGIECHRIGEKPGSIHQSNVASWLNKADIIFSLGRGAIETMMCGKIPIIFDYQGGDGMVTPANIRELSTCNFSGRLYAKQYRVDEMIREIEHYKAENAPILQGLSIDLFDAHIGVSRLITYLKEALMDTEIERGTKNQEAVKALVEIINTTKEYTIETIRRHSVISASNSEAVIEDKTFSTHKEARSYKNTIPPKVSIIIPLFNKVDYTKRCISAIKANTPEGIYELVIVDNGSTDGTAVFLKNLRGARIITNSENAGFAKACNQGANAAKGAYLLFLNNDTEPRNKWLEPLIEILDKDDTVCAAGSKLLFPDDTIQHAGVMIIEDRKLPDLLVARHIYYKQPSQLPEANQLRTYQALTAACILIRKACFEKVGGFDEGYWNGYEDIDLCFKLQESGEKLVYQPESVVVHHESKSGDERFKRVHHNINRLHDCWLGKIKTDFIIDEDGTSMPTDAHRIQPYPSMANNAPEKNFITSKRQKTSSLLSSSHIISFRIQSSASRAFKSTRLNPTRLFSSTMDRRTGP